MNESIIKFFKKEKKLQNLGNKELMSNLVWIFKNKFNAQRRKDALIDRFCKVINEHEDGPPICRYDQFIEEEFQCKSEEEIQDLVEEAEEYYRKPLQIVK